MLLEKSGGDIPTFAGVAEVSLDDLRQILEGQKVVGDERATHIELTLELGQGWLDKKHEMSDITQTTIDILSGKDVSTFEKEIRNSELKGHEIMKNTASTAASTSSATPAAKSAPTATPAAKSSASQNSTSDKASNEIVEARIANLTLLTQARGAKSRLARLLGVSESIVSFLFSRSKEFTNSFTRNLETVLALPEMWMDTVRDVPDVPHETWEKLGGSANLKGDTASKKGRKAASNKDGASSAEKSGDAVAQNTAAAKSSAPAEGAPRGKRVHRLPPKSAAGSQPETKPGSSQGSLTLQLRPSAAPSLLLNKGGAETLPELDTPEAVGAAAEKDPRQLELPTTANDAAKTVGSATGEVSNSALSATQQLPEAATSSASTPASASAKAPAPTGADASASAAPAAAAPAQSTATSSAPEGAPAPGVQVAAFVPAQTPADHGHFPSADVVELNKLYLSPITEALLKTLALKAKQGVFSEMDALRLLGEIAVL